VADTIDKCYKHTSLKLAGEGRGGLGWDVGRWRGRGGGGRNGEQGRGLGEGEVGWSPLPLCEILNTPL